MSIGRRVSRALGKGIARGICGAFCCSLMLGCFTGSGVPDSAYQQALELVDQGTLLLRAQRTREADALFALAYELAPLAAALDGRGCVAIVEGDLDRAEEYLIRAFREDRTYDHALTNLALIYELRGEVERARALYQTVLERYPDAPAARHNVAALEYDTVGGSHGASNEDLGRLNQELMKSFALSGNGVVAENMIRIEEARRHEEKNERQAGSRRR